ncbi:hypothetical protein FisN_18Lu046 [Fistulifera solaris]|uniref:Uncharacterized protein n=1 Tax=Fistulifera solaris TaxID=1519565 RepID=A0A1Z5K1E5_FISSO|nr:hypothetical protein FisN_18Lu046 [Fistulifera solaris]|eukprot:GAX20105.1 hypothetical protein FisN_18Lu046 [Fistulifera solaris]
MDCYNGKRAPIFHLCRCHNRKGPEEEYLQQMNTLWKGFSCFINRKSKRGPHNVEDNVAKEQDDSDDFKEGKVAMSPQLYRSVCKWLVEFGSKKTIANQAISWYPVKLKNNSFIVYSLFPPSASNSVAAFFSSSHNAARAFDNYTVFLVDSK